ncbi:MAG: chromosome partitioning protein ParB [Deltaproteobacteria bacterium]|jgi:hypothetical protein|nr:chromosome partitioning protein ParB [Deltaproteobacteria bacterium]
MAKTAAASSPRAPKPKSPRGAKPGPKRANAPESAQLVRVNFDITRAEHTKLKIFAAKNGISMADLLRGFVTKIKLSSVK